MQCQLFDFEKPNYHNGSFPEPRQFQVTAHQRLREGVRSGHRSQVLMAPTGAGKSFIGMKLIHEALKKGKRAMFVCDRTALIDQASEVADRYGLSAHGVIQGQHWRHAPEMPFQIASVQTLARRTWPATDLIIIDECHTRHAAWVEHIKTCDAKSIGLSATPFSVGLGRIFTNLVNAATMHDLTQSGVLVPMRVFSCTKADMAGAETSGGEWTDRAAGERGMEIIGDVVAEWCKHAAGLKTIVFGATIAHCEEMARQFMDAGIMAAVFTANTKPEERKALLDEYRKPDSMIRVLISVEALSKGFDAPDVECVADCRPLRKSLSTFMQMCGRGLRSSPETSKKECRLLDFSGNIIRFAEDFSDIYYNGLDALDMGEKLDRTIRRDKPEEPDGKACPSCGFSPFAKRCISCGFEARSRSTVEHIPGSMQEITIGGKRAASGDLDLWSQCCTYAKSYGRPEKAAGWAWHLFKEIAGRDLPRGMPSFHDAPNVLITRPVMNLIKHRQIAYAKAREKAA